MIKTKPRPRDYEPVLKLPGPVSQWPDNLKLVSQGDPFKLMLAAHTVSGFNTTGLFEAITAGNPDGKAAQRVREAVLAEINASRGNAWDQVWAVPGPSTTGAPWLLLPAETKAREFHAKLLLGAMAVERGYSVVLGEQNAMVRQLAHLPRGLYIDKSVAATKIKHFRRLRQWGNKVAAWCEKGLVYRDRDAYLQQRIDPAFLVQVERFFCWGGVQQEDIAGKMARDVCGARGKLVATGNPRFDLLRSGYRESFTMETQALRKQYGDFILVNTNFARYNHFHGAGNFLEAQRQRGNVEIGAQEDSLVAWRDFLGQIYHAFAAMLEPLSLAFTNHQIILRPHPSENHERWADECSGLDNVRVVFEGNVVPWLQAARVLMHNSCTTGLEPV